MLLQYQSAQVVEDEHLSEHIVSEQCFSDLDALQDYTDRDAAGTDANSSLVRPEIVILRDPQEAEAEAARQQQALPLPLP